MEGLVGKNKHDGKTKKRTRTATFIRGKRHLDLAALAVMPRTANVVHRAALNQNAPFVRGAPTVYFKPHDDEQAPSQYAVASTRLARFLKMPNVIAHNAFARVKGSPGVVSGEVPGAPFVKHKKDAELPSPPKNASKKELAEWMRHFQAEERDGKYYTMSGEIYRWINFRDPRIQKGLFDLQLFDAISGQDDRHGANIYIDPQTGQVSGIDDDWSFGKGVPVAKQGEPGTKYVGLPALVDEGTAEQILALDPQDLREELLARVNDSKELSDKEIDDARLRLEGVQDHLRKLKAQGLLVKTWDDATYQQAIQNPRNSYLGRGVADLERATRGAAANDPTYEVVNMPPTLPPALPPIPTATTTTTTSTTQPPPSLTPQPPPPTMPPLGTLPPQPSTSTPSPRPTSPPAPPTTPLGPPTPSRAAAIRLAATRRPRKWVRAVSSARYVPDSHSSWVRAVPSARYVPDSHSSSESDSTASSAEERSLSEQ
jgi:hypothetical protein